MGFFSSKKIITVSSMSYQLGETEENPLATNTLLAIYSGTPIVDMVRQMATNGMANNVRKARNYAIDSYTLGLPSGSYDTRATVSDSDLATAIVADMGYTTEVVVDTVSIEPLTPYFYAREYLLQYKEWDQLTNDIGVFPSTSLNTGPADEAEHPTTYTCEVTTITPSDDWSTVTITYLVHCFQDALMLEEIEALEHEGGHTVHDYVWLPNEFETKTVTETLIVPTTLILGAEHYIVTYRLVETTGYGDITYTWYYAVGDTTYPNLAKQADTVDDYSGCPVIPMRYDNEDLCDESLQDGELYKTSKVLLDKLGLDIDDIAESINSSDSVGDIDHAYIMFGINMQTDEKNSLTYLVHFFDKLSDTATNTRLEALNDYYNGVDSNGANAYTQGYTDVDNTVSLVEEGLNISISYNYIISELREGNIGTTEEPASIGDVTKTFTRQDDSYDTYTEIDHSDGGISTTITNEWDNSTVVLKLQKTDSVYQYVEVSGLTQTNLIYSKNNLAVVTTITDLIDDEDENNLIIPVDYNVALNMGIFPRNQMYEESLQLIMNSVTITKEKWYQSSWFKLVSYIIMAVITYVSWGTMTAQIAAAFASLTAFAQFVVISIVAGYAIKAAFAWVATQIGADWLAIIGIIVMALSLYTGSTSTFSVMGQSIGTAQMLMKMSTCMINTATEVMEDEIASIASDYEDYVEVIEAKWDVLEDLQDELDTELTGQDILDAQTARITFSPLIDSPELFYELTIHTGNVGVTVLDIIPDYCNIMLTLPEPEDIA